MLPSRRAVRLTDSFTESISAIPAGMVKTLKSPSPRRSAVTASAPRGAASDLACRRAISHVPVRDTAAKLNIPPHTIATRPFNGPFATAATTTPITMSPSETGTAMAS